MAQYTPKFKNDRTVYACEWFWTRMQTFPPHLHRVKYGDGTQDKSQTQRGGCMDMCRYLVGPWAGSLQRFPLTGPEGCQRCQICISVLHLCQLQLLHLKRKTRKKRECAFDRHSKIQSIFPLAHPNPRGMFGKKTESCYWWWIFHFSSIDFTDSLWQRTQAKGLCENTQICYVLSNTRVDERYLVNRHTTHPEGFHYILFPV